MIGYKLILVFLAAYFSSIFAVRAQDITPPERPVLTYVTIDTLTGNTHLFWTESTSPDVKWYYLYYEVSTVSGMEGVKLDSLSPGVSSYIHTGTNGKEPLVYTISAIDSSGNESLRTPGFHQAVYVSLQYDSCRNAMNLQWNPYLGWGENLSGYRAYKRRAGEAYGPPVGVGKNGNSFRFENINSNQQYFFYVEALKNDTLISISNKASKYTYMPGPPDNFNLINVNVVSENAVEINFEFTDTSGINDFRLLRSIGKNADFTSIATSLDLVPGTNVFIDNIITGAEKYFYKIGSVNSCNKIISETNLGTNILLSGINENTRNILNWNFYEEWATGVEEYQLQILNDQQNPVVIHTFGPTENNYRHALEEFFGAGYQGNLLYRIAAKKEGDNIFSYSNVLNLEASSTMSVPSAFTPNNDGLNDIFKPVFTLFPEKYRMIIYDRYGISVFRTENPDQGWDGRVNGGEPALEGVYVYHIQYTSFTGTATEKTGHLTLFYP